MSVRALIVDLDNTLVPEMANYEQAFDDGCRAIADELRLDVAELRRSVFTASHGLWATSRWSAYCLRLGIGSPTSLLTDLPGGPPDLAELRTWMPEYRRRSWERGLAAQGVDVAFREELGMRLDAAFRARQRQFCPPYSDALPAVELAGRDYRLALTTNGPSDVQRAKLRASGLDRFFPVVVVSADIGTGKPDPEIFRIALDQLGVTREEAVVVGDSHERDIVGAFSAGIASILVDRSRTNTDGPPRATATIASLADLASAVATLSPA
ncbi:MAG TPA: HAD family hydrolase [Candidatus Limnocylindria bacterium]|nr:HAD family hydrolase [Candidatus Limnocylindria bacterium]